MAGLPSADAVPESLRHRDQWVAWHLEERRGKPTRVPLDPRTGEVASPTAADSWGSFTEAREYVDASAADGIGFVFTESGPYVGVVLDECRVPATGTLTDTALDVLDRLNSYSELTPAGAGVQTFVRADCPAGRTRRGNVEVVGADRFIPVTGRHVHRTPPAITRRDDALAAVYRDYVKPSPESTTAEEEVADGTSGREPGPPAESATSERRADRRSTRERPSTDGSDPPPAKAETDDSGGQPSPDAETSFLDRVVRWLFG